MDGLLGPIPENPRVNSFEITIEIETGNLIYKSFTDVEELLEFIQNDAQDSAKIRDLISPKTRKKKIGEQSTFYLASSDEIDEDW